MIPNYTEDGLLPPGIYEATWDEIVRIFGANEHRCKLIKGLHKALINLKNAGCKRIYINGSFVTLKEYPNDFDACWEMQGVDSSLMDPILLKFDNGRISQKAKYHGELLPNGVEGGTGLKFSDFFQIDKDTGKQKGILTINLEGFK